MILSMNWRYRISYAMMCIFALLSLLGPVVIGYPDEPQVELVLRWKIVLSVASLGVAGYAFLALSSYRVVLAEEALIAGRRYIPFQKPGRLQYMHVVKVAPGPMQGLVAVESRLGGTLEINAACLQGGPERLFVELARRLEPGVVDTSLPRPKRPIRWQRVLALYLLAGALCLAAVWLVSGKEIAMRRWVAWRMTEQLGERADIGISVLDGEGHPWVNTFQWETGQDAVAHILPEGVQYFPLPEDLPSGDYPESLGYDSAGRPWVVFGDKVLHWTGKEWQSLPLPIKGYLLALVDAHSGALAMRSLTAHNKISSMFTVDWESGQITPLPLPANLEASAGDNLLLHWLPGHALLACIGRHLYTFEQGTWQDTGSILADPPAGIVEDVTRDAGGRLWALIQEPRGKSSLGRFDPQAAQWEWFPMEACCQQGFKNSEAIEVDAQGRIWVSSILYTAPPEYLRRSVRVYQLEAGGRLAQVSEYSEQNSAYSGPRGLRLAPDGRLWNGARWIDTNAETLPSPLPAWLSPVDGKVAGAGVGAAWLVAGLILLAKIRVGEKGQGDEIPKT